MANYLVRPGYCLHLPHGRFGLPGEEVELTGDLEREILLNQGWKLEAVRQPEPGPPEPEPEGKEVPGTPKDRAVKEAKVK